MLTINGQQFAETEKEVIDSLFQPGATVTGKAQRRRRSIHLHRLNGELVGVVTAGGVIGTARRMEDGRNWYSYGDCVLVGPMPLHVMADTVRALSTGRDARGFMFK